jgi:hypothetical protein
MPNPTKTPKPSRAAQIAKCICEIPDSRVEAPYMFWTRPLNKNFKLKKLHKTILEKMESRGWYARNFDRWSESSWKKCRLALLELIESGYIGYGVPGVIEDNKLRRMNWAERVVEILFQNKARPDEIFHYLNHSDE